MPRTNPESPLVGSWPARLVSVDSGRALDAERGIFLVPACRDGGDGRDLALSFVRVPSKRDLGLPPLVVLTGGPSGNAIRAFETGFFEHVERLSEICDVVTFDQRGCHSALPELANPFGPDLDTDAERTRETFLASQRRNASLLAGYFAERGVDLNDYNTIESAHDVDALRRALGASTINLHGASYGSHLGLTVLKLHGERVERAILCIVEGLNDTHKLPANTDRHFEHLADLAREDPALAGQCARLLEEIGGVLDTFANRPLPLKLPSFDTPIPIGKFVVQCVLGGALGSIRAIKGLPAFVRQLSRSDLSTLKRRADRLLSAPGLHGMMLAMDAASGATADRMAQIEAERHRALLDDSFNLPFPFVGDALGVKDLGDEFRKPVEGDTPTLFCCGSLDGRTPISNAVAARRGFPNSELVVVEGASHEVPTELLDAHVKFLSGEDVGQERIVRPFSFDPIANP